MGLPMTKKSDPRWDTTNAIIIDDPIDPYRLRTALKELQNRILENYDDGAAMTKKSKELGDTVDDLGVAALIAGDGASALTVALTEMKLRMQEFFDEAELSAYQDATKQGARPARSLIYAPPGAAWASLRSDALFTKKVSAVSKMLDDMKARRTSTQEPDVLPKRGARKIVLE